MRTIEYEDSLSAATPLEHPAWRQQHLQSTLKGARGLDPRDNSLNLIRLLLASAVLVSHSFPLAGLPEPTFAGTTLGGWAVIGFFSISGYLITGSRWRTPFGSYLVHRILRIFPAFLVCLVVTAFAFAPVAFFVERGTLDGFLATPNTPVSYVLVNSSLRMVDYSIAGTLGGVPLPSAWNGSLWTLYYEFLCYLIIGVLASFALFRRGPWGIVVAFVLSVALHAWIGQVVAHVGGGADLIFLAKLLPYFLGGALLFVVRERIPLVWPVALVSATVTVVCVLLWNSWGGQLAAPFFAVVLLWLGRVVPSPGWFQRHDVSYGTYVYAFPVQQLLALAGIHHLGQIVYIAAAIVPTAVLATLSWFLVERPVMRRARGRKPNAGDIAALRA